MQCFGTIDGNLWTHIRFDWIWCLFFSIFGKLSTGQPTDRCVVDLRIAVFVGCIQWRREDKVVWFPHDGPERVWLGCRVRNPYWWGLRIGPSPSFILHPKPLKEKKATVQLTLVALSRCCVSRLPHSHTHTLHAPRSNCLAMAISQTKRTFFNCKLSMLNKPETVSTEQSNEFESPSAVTLHHLLDFSVWSIFVLVFFERDDFQLLSDLDGCI